ncbi:MAG: F-box/WD40 repeat-containing protein [Parachlamydiales bacterium]
MTTKAVTDSTDTVYPAPATLTEQADIEQDSLLLDCPDEIILPILFSLGEKDLASASLTCRRLYVLANDTFLWKNLFFKTFPYRATKVTPYPMIAWKPFHQDAYRIESNLLHGICQEKTLPAHDARITSIHHQTPYLFTADSEGTLKVRSRHPEHLYADVQTISGCQGGSIQFHAETGTIAFPTEDGSIRLLRKPSPQEPFDTVQVLPGDGSKIEQFSLEKKHLFFVTGNRNFYIWSKDLSGNYANPASIPDIMKFACFSNEVAVLKSDSTIAILKINEDKSVDYSYSPAETTPSLGRSAHIVFTDENLFICNLFGMVKVFAKEAEGPLKEIQNMPLLTQFPDSITSLLAHEDYLISGSLKGQARIFRRQPSKEYAEIPCPAVHTDRINQIVMKEGFLCIASTDSKTSLLRKNPAGEFIGLKELQNLDQGATTVAIEDDRFISGYADGQMRIWDFT